MHNPETNKDLVRLIQTWVKNSDTLPNTQSDAQKLIGMTALVSMLSNLEDNEGNPLIIFKGGNSLIIRFGINVRTTRDIDAATNLELDTAFELIQTQLNQGWNGFKGKIQRREELDIPSANPPPQRCEIKLSYINKSFVTIDFELSRVSPTLIYNRDLVTSAVDLTPVPFEQNHQVALLNIHFQIAQKIHACTQTFETGINKRVRDLFDICLLESLAKEDGLEKTKQACIQTFQERDTHSWPPSLPNHSSWPELWEGLEISEDLRIDYNQAHQKVTELIKQIDNS